MTEEQKDKLYSKTHRYLGKDLKRTGESKRGPYKIFQLRFDVGGQYPWKVDAFEPMSEKGVQPTAMVEGDFYEVVYKENEYNHPQYGPQKSRQAVLIKQSTEANKSPDVKKAQPETGTAGTAFSAEKWNAFATEYDKATQGSSDVNAMHMLGAYVANITPNLMPEVISRCKAHFQKPKEEKVEDTVPPLKL